MSPESLKHSDEFLPATQAELSRYVADNASDKKLAIYPVGGRTALHYGYPAQKPGVLLSTASLTQIIDYPARDMTITVEAGTRVDELAATLKAEGQQLPIDVPQSNRATLGGIVATNTSGPRRYAYGTLRDYVIGVSAVDAGGKMFRAGGRVVKNVAGYDLCKMLIGSLGTLAVVSELTLKLKPIPETTKALWTSWNSFSEIDAALEQLLKSSARPVCLEVLNPHAAKQIMSESRQSLSCNQPVLIIGVEGAESDARWQMETLTQELSTMNPLEIQEVPNEQTPVLWDALTDYQTYSDDPLSFRANLLPSKTIEFMERATEQGIALQAHAGNGIVIGHLPDDAVTLEKANHILTPLRQLARKYCGNLIILNCETAWKKELPIFGDAENSLPLMKRLKTTLDPHNLLNPCRLFPADNSSTSIGSSH